MLALNKFKTIKNVYSTLVLSGVLLCCFVMPVQAAFVMSMTLEDVVNQSDDIVVARCVDVSSRWQGDKIVTDITLEVMQRVKGEDGFRLVVTILGGTAQHPRLHTLVNMHVPGGISFKQNEMVLVFSKRNASGINQVVGLNQGKYSLEMEEASGEFIIPVGQKVLTTSSDHDDARTHADFSGNEDHFHTHEGVTIAERVMRLDEFVGRIEAVMAGDE